MRQIAHDTTGLKGVESPSSFRAMFGLDGSAGAERAARGDVMPEERQPRQIAVMN